MHLIRFVKLVRELKPILRSHFCVSLDSCFVCNSGGEISLCNETKYRTPDDATGRFLGNRHSQFTVLVHWSIRWAVIRASACSNSCDVSLQHRDLRLVAKRQLASLRPSSGDVSFVTFANEVPSPRFLTHVQLRDGTERVVWWGGCEDTSCGLAARRTWPRHSPSSGSAWLSPRFCALEFIARPSWLLHQAH